MTSLAQPVLVLPTLKYADVDDVHDFNALWCLHDTAGVRKLLCARVRRYIVEKTARATKTVFKDLVPKHHVGVRCYKNVCLMR